MQQNQPSVSSLPVPEDNTPAGTNSTPPSRSKQTRKAAKELPDGQENRSARAEGHRSRIDAKRSTTITRARSLPAKKVSFQDYKITLKKCGPLSEATTKALHTLVPMTSLIESNETTDPEVEEDDPDLRYDHTYTLHFNNQENLNSAADILRNSTLITISNYSFLPSGDVLDPNSRRSPERSPS